jgi:hypothetical protein
MRSQDDPQRVALSRAAQREVGRSRSMRERRCEPGRVGVEALALSHDGLWVFAHRIFADWRRRHRGWLLARQIGGSGNAQHGDEPSRYDYDDLHDANPLVLGTRTGRPSDAPIPLCLCKTPALPSHVPAQSPGEWLPTICRFGDRLVQMRSVGSGSAHTTAGWPSTCQRDQTKPAGEWLNGFAAAALALRAAMHL